MIPSSTRVSFCSPSPLQQASPAAIREARTAINTHPCDSATFEAVLRILSHRFIYYLSSRSESDPRVPRYFLISVTIMLMINRYVFSLLFSSFFKRYQYVSHERFHPEFASELSRSATLSSMAVLRSRSYTECEAPLVSEINVPTFVNLNSWILDI